MTLDATASGKGENDENFPVAHLIAPALRPAVMAFYRFARAADDVADHPTLPAERKLALLEDLRAGLTGEAPPPPVALALRQALAARRMGPDHALDLLEAFRRDCVKNRTADWADLLDYCRYSAAPVGRFMLDLHGEDRATWPASDIVCAALQINNHWQDCGEDFRERDRVYVPASLLAAHGADVAMLGAGRATPQLRAALLDGARKTQAMLDETRGFADDLRDRRLALNIAAIHALAVYLNSLLLTRDPLSEPVHAGKKRFALIAAGAALRQQVRRFAGGTPARKSAARL